MADSDWADLAAREADATKAAMDKMLADETVQVGIGTVTAINPGSVAGTVAVDTGSGTSFPMRRNAGYSPTIGDLVKWTRSAAGDWFCDYELA